jgi:hypothetical protein
VTLTPEQAWRIAWTRGGRHLESALMHRVQLDAFDRYRHSEARRFVLLWTRRGGKSFGGVTHAIATCLARPGIDYKFAAPTQDMARSIVYPHAQDVLASCPEDLLPRVHKQSMTWTFKNGSVLKLAGCDGLNANRLRGTSLDEAFVDEAGFVSDLRSVVEDVLMPQTITTNGRIILASTPPVSPAHPFAAEYVPRATADDAIVRRTIYEMPHIPREKAEEYIAEAGGPESTTARREYMAEIVIDESMAIVPEFQRARDTIVREWPAWDFREWYVSGDFGFHDLTVVLFAWYDFPKAKLVIEDEIAMQGASGLEVGHAVKAKEHALGIAKPRARVADAPAQLLADLAHPTMGPAVPFAPAIKDDAEAALNTLRMCVQRGEVVINPRCKVLIQHLAEGTWNASRTGFSREAGRGHWDAIDALKYLLRVVERNRNATPDVLPGTRRDEVLMPRVKPRPWNETAPSGRTRWTT